MPGERWGRMAGMHVESLGLSPVKGTSWLQRDVVDLTRHGLAGDRRWSPVGPDLRCVKATDVPWLAGVRVTPADLPPPQSALHGGEQRTVMYYDRAFRCQLHDGELAARLSEAAARRSDQMSALLASADRAEQGLAPLRDRQLPGDERRHQLGQGLGADLVDHVVAVGPVAVEALDVGEDEELLRAEGDIEPV